MWERWRRDTRWEKWRRFTPKGTTASATTQHAPAPPIKEPQKTKILPLRHKNPNLRFPVLFWALCHDVRARPTQNIESVVAVTCVNSFGSTQLEGRKDTREVRGRRNATYTKQIRANSKRIKT